jgi:oligopeptide transport system permease protein
MLAYTVRRLLIAIPTVFIIITLAFFMLRAAPGGPLTGDRALPPEIEANIKAAYDLDKPLVEQYAIYLGNVLQGDFGPSFKNKDFSVSQLIASGAPVSIQIGVSAIIIALIVGIALGTSAALRQNSFGDFGVMTLAMVGITIPTFVMGPLLQLLFGLQFNILPVGGYGGGDPRHLILPIIVLALPQIAIMSRLVRGSMIEVLRSNYVRTARAKGLPEFLVIWRHTLRAGLLPLVAYLGPAAAALLTGSLVVEQVFDLPGLGQFFVRGALDRDYTLVMGLVILFATLIIILNLISDLVIALLDPKVRFD